MNEILEGNKLILKFMNYFESDSEVYLGYFTNGEKAFHPREAKYHTSWDWLVPACQQWDNTWHDEWNAHQVEKYTSLSDELDHFATLYEIEPLWRQLVINIKWYNQNKTS